MAASTARLAAEPFGRTRHRFMMLRYSPANAAALCQTSAISSSVKRQSASGAAGFRHTRQVARKHHQAAVCECRSRMQREQPNEMLSQALMCDKSWFFRRIRELACALGQGCFVARCRGGRRLGRRLRRGETLALRWLRGVRRCQAGATLLASKAAREPPDAQWQRPLSRRGVVLHWAGVPTMSRSVLHRSTTSAQRRAHSMCIAANAATKRTLLPVAVRDTIRCTACLPARGVQPVNVLIPQCLFVLL